MASSTKAASRQSISNKKNAGEPAYMRIRRAIEVRIQQGEWALGACIPTEDEICRAFATSRITAMRVLNDLEDAGYVERIRGKGTVLRSTAPRVVCRHVHIVSQMGSHLHAPLVQRLSFQIDAMGAQTLLSSPDKLDNPAHWDAVAAMGGALVIEGCSTPALDAALMRDWNAFTRIVFVLGDGLAVRPYPASSVALDFGAIGRIQADHAIAAGYRKIIFLTFPLKAGEAAHHAHAEAIRATCAAAGVEARIFDGLAAVPERCAEDVAYATEVLREVGPGCAILGNSDYHAAFACRAAQALGWRMGAEVGAIGLYNTPWADLFAMTSLDVRIDDIAADVARILATNAQERLTPEPRLVARASTAR